MIEENFDDLVARITEAEKRRDVVHRSRLSIHYRFWVDERMFDGIFCKVLNFAFISKALPEGFVWYWSRLPKFPPGTEETAQFYMEAEAEAAHLLCGACAVAEYGRALLFLASEATEWRTAMVDQIGRPVDGIELLKEHNKEAAALADKITGRVRDHAMKVLAAEDGRKVAFSFPNLDEAHQKLKVLWREAAGIAKEALKSKLPERRAAWKAEVQAFFQRFGFHPVDDDLVTRLDDPDKWPDDLHDKLIRHGAEGKPYDIALEHAARLYGFPPYSDYALSLRQLKEHLKKSKKTGEVIGVDHLTQSGEKSTKKKS
jgi:hypothetical protein